MIAATYALLWQPRLQLLCRMWLRERNDRYRSLWGIKDKDIICADPELAFHKSQDRRRADHSPSTVFQYFNTNPQMIRAHASVKLR